MNPVLFPLRQIFLFSFSCPIFMNLPRDDVFIFIDWLDY